MPIVVHEQDLALSEVWPTLPKSVPAILKEANRVGIIPSPTRMFFVLGLDPTIEQMTAFLHKLTTQTMSRCANEGNPEEGLLFMKNACIVAFGKACEAAIVSFRIAGTSGTSGKVDIMLDPGRLRIPDFGESTIYPEPQPFVNKMLGELWSQFTSDTILPPDTLRLIGEHVAYGALLFVAHRDLMFQEHEAGRTNERITQAEIKGTLEYIFRIGASFALQRLVGGVWSKIPKQ